MRDWIRDRKPVQHPDQCNQILTEAAELSFFRGEPAAANVPWTPSTCGNLLEKLIPFYALTQLDLRASQEQHRQQVRQRQKERAAKFGEGVDEAKAEGASHVAYFTLKAA